MFTFNAPCLRYKLVLTTKNQNGWPGFLPPYNTRYLNQQVTITSTPAFDYPNGPVTTSTGSYITDRLTGRISLISGIASANFPYGEPLNQNGSDPSQPGYENWQVTDTQFTHTINNGYFVITTTVQLSNPYTLGQLDADANAQLASVSLVDVPWNSLVFAPNQETSIAIGPYSPNGDMSGLLPAQVEYPGITTPGPCPVSQLNAAAWYIYVPGSVSSQNWFPNGYSKLISYIAMAGNYCQKTYWLDYQLNVLNESCQSGQGSCKSAFKVTPPPPVAGQNAYLMIVPNCQCGG